MFRAIILPIFRSTTLCVTACGIMHRRCCRPVAGNIVGALLLHLVGCLYYLYKWCTVKKIWDNEIYLLIKCIKSVLWRAVKRLSYIEDALCLKVNRITCTIIQYDIRIFRLSLACQFVFNSWSIKLCSLLYLLTLYRMKINLCN